MKILKNKLFKSRKPETNKFHKEFVEKTFKLLYKYGITDEINMKSCARKMMYATKKFMQEIQSYAARGMDIEPLFVPQVQHQNDILEEFGIADPESRDNMVVEYFALVKEMGEQ